MPCSLLKILFRSNKIAAAVIAVGKLQFTAVIYLVALEWRFALNDVSTDDHIILTVSATCHLFSTSAWGGCFNGECGCCSYICFIVSQSPIGQLSPQNFHHRRQHCYLFILHMLWIGAAGIWGSGINTNM
jgi:hypothetical protein